MNRIEIDTVPFRNITPASQTKMSAYSNMQESDSHPVLPPLNADLFEDSAHIYSIMSGDTLYVDKRSAYEGQAGDPIPYTMANDNWINSLLLIILLLVLFASAQSHRFIKKQAKTFFSAPRREFSDLNETSNELQFQFFLGLQTCLLMGMLFFFYNHTNNNANYDFHGQYIEIGIYGFMTLLYYVVKSTLYWVAGWVFFDINKNKIWQKALLFLVSMQGVLLIPAVMLCAYFKTSPEHVAIYTLFVIFFIKILTLYRLSLIFFKGKTAYLQNILYFCALEVIPAGIFSGLLLYTSKYLSIIF